MLCKKILLFSLTKIKNNFIKVMFFGAIEFHFTKPKKIYTRASQFKEKKLCVSKANPNTFVSILVRDFSE